MINYLHERMVSFSALWVTTLNANRSDLTTRYILISHLHVLQFEVQQMSNRTQLWNTKLRLGYDFVNIGHLGASENQVDIKYIFQIVEKSKAALSAIITKCVLAIRECFVLASQMYYNS